MSDQAPETTSASPAANPVIANAQQALAVKELSEAVAGMKKKIKTLWIAFAVLAVVTVVIAVFAIGPRFGLNMGGTRTGFPTGTFPRNGTGGTQGGTNDQAPVPPTQ